MGIISDSIFFKHHIIKENIEDKKYKWLRRSYALKDSFWSEFFEFSIENSCADMYDLFESGRKNSLRKYIKSINETTGAKYYKMMAFIHLTDFVRKRNMGLTEKGYTSFKEIFKPDKTEKRFFDLLMRCFLEFNDEFIDLRNAVFLKYVFGSRPKNSLRERSNIRRVEKCEPFFKWII